MNKSDLMVKAGKYWVETKNGELGCVMDNGIIFKNGSHHMNNYNDDLVNKYYDNATIIKILQPKTEDYCGNYERKSEFDIVYEVNQLRPITSLDQLEEVRKEMCEKYGTSFYITNESGEYEIKFNGLAQGVGCVDDFQVEVAHVTNLQILGVRSYRNNTQAKCGEIVFFDWETGLITDNPFRAVDLEKEGYKLEI